MRLAGGSHGSQAAAVAALSLALLLAFLLGVLTGPATAHTEGVVLSPPSSVEVAVDGHVSTSEWAEAVAIELLGTTVEGSSGTLLVKHNDSFLFVALDVVGDVTEEPGDLTLIAFDTGHDGRTSVGEEDIFYHSEFFDGGQAHLEFDGPAWAIHDSPYDTSLANHVGLASAWGFGPSGASPLNHRQVEFRIPLPLLGTAQGDDLGFLVAVSDSRTGGASYWPRPVFGVTLNDYGDLLLTEPSGPAGVLLLPPSQLKAARAGDTVAYTLNVTNRGTAGPDTVDLVTTSPWPVSFWNAGGTAPLQDSDVDGHPDTGLLASGASVAVVARVEVPPSATERGEAIVTATSSVDGNVSTDAQLIIELPPALFDPPHLDFGDDTDVPPDGTFDDLILQTNITVVRGGTYVIDGILSQENVTTALAFASRLLSVGIGNHTVELAFAGEDLYRARTDGPYEIHLILSDARGSLDRSDHTTELYPFTAFQKPAAAFVRPHAEAGLDTDGDGLFNYLVVDAQIEVQQDGFFLLRSSVQGTPLGETSNFTALAAGLHTVPVWISGERLNASELDGPYEVSLSLFDFLTVQLLDRDTHTTAVYSHLAFESPPAAFARPHADAGLDTDGDGLFNQLIAEANLTVDQAGTYRVEGTLRGSRIGSASNTTMLAKGTHTVPLWFDGVRINASQVDGPYTVELRLYNATVFVFLDAETHTTAAYGHDEFEEPPARFDPPHFDFGRDDDADGLFDFLVLNVTLDVDVAAQYTVEGTLRDANSVVTLFASNESNLEVGRQSRHLNFPAPRLNASAVDGPYTVSLELIQRGTLLVLDSDAHATAAYAHGDFDGPLGQFGAPHGDHGRDEDGDGLFDVLVVEVLVSVEAAGTFYVQGALSDSAWDIFLTDSNLTSLEGGLQSVELAFDGVPLNVSTADGPYDVDLSLFDWVTGDFLDNETHTTSAYSHQAFDGLTGRFASPHADRGWDADGDGLFEDLVVDVEVEIFDAGNFTFDAFLYDPSFALFTFIRSHRVLGVGQQAVPLSFDGALINISGIDGPYTVELFLTDAATFRTLDFDVHTTTPFPSTAFEGPEPLWALPSEIGPTIDGVIAAGEWDDAFVVDLGRIGGNAVPGFLLVKNDWRFVYVAYDATGDTTEDAFDVASIAFDTGHDGVATHGGEDQFVQGGWVPNDQAHFVYDVSFGGWVLEDSPLESTLPDHQGLASAWGFGATAREGTPHRIYEFAVPLSLVEATPGDILGFFGGSRAAPGLFDDSVAGWSLWPVWDAGALSLVEYGDLVLANLTDLVPPTLIVQHPASDATIGNAEVRIVWFASDGQSGLDHLEVSLDDGNLTELPPTVFSHTFSGLAEGPHTARLQAVDRGGNVQTAFLNFTVDTVPPTVLVLSPFPDRVLNRSSVNLAWLAGDATSGINALQLILDGAVLADLPATATSSLVEGLEDGRHVLEVRVIDRAGHEATASVAVTVDTVPPVLAVSLPVKGTVITTSSVEVVWEATDPTSGVALYEVRLDDGMPFVTATSSSLLLAEVPDGMHTLTVSAFDRAGNEATVAVTFRVDTNVLSPTGPLGAGPLVALLAAAGVAGAVLLFYLRRRGRPPT